MIQFIILNLKHFAQKTRQSGWQSGSNIHEYWNNTCLE